MKAKLWSMLDINYEYPTLLKRLEEKMKRNSEKKHRTVAMFSSSFSHVLVLLWTFAKNNDYDCISKELFHVKSIISCTEQIQVQKCKTHSRRT